MAGYRKSGFSLVEVLVSIMMLAVGVIGAAGMQLASLRTTQQSVLQTFAFQLAADVADAIYANGLRRPDEREAAHYVGLDYRSTEGEPPAPGKLCYVNVCDADEFAAFEMYEWKKRVKATLPGGRIVVCRDSAPWSSAQRSLTWDCSGGTGDGGPLVVKLGWQEKNPDGSLVKDGNNQFPPNVALTVAL